MDGGMDRPDYWPSPIGHQDYHSPRPPSSARARAPWPIMQPFRTLVAFVKRCPWAVISDLGSPGPSASDDIYYPSVPRSLLHDTAVSFVVKDHTRPDLPEFVISCPFEHVDLVHQLLAPDGSRRQLSARGTSGQPRNGSQLRSMLLDGIPSIELTLHRDAGGDAGGPNSRQRPSTGNDGGAVASRPGPGGGWNTGGPDNSNVKGDGGQHTSPMNEPAGITKSPVFVNPFAAPPMNEPDVEHPRSREDIPTPFSAATPLQAFITPPWSSPLPPSSGQEGGVSQSSLQATVETAPPTPCMDPVKVDQDDPAPVALEEGREDRNEDRVEGHGDPQQDSPGGIGEPPTLFYVQPSPEQIQRGEPLTGWLCEPQWLRRRLRDLTRGNMQGDQ
ncbi:hypothetical protein INS49_013251 [Diaporthe citri]|uniref:uncharacterized protein n=1 Tax=Diaporthe citri TaxID=83186 RepID=UPI001C7EC030|nr:uncharacterized protein INS49_013251 [Diaporthe citri]KAG6357374.1 hypothetical protein INS49_013251 [Diaporthe citri]